MSPPWANIAQASMSGKDRRMRAVLARGLLRAASIPYASATRIRNAVYDSGLGVKHAAVPVISVGNITTGGTGKTPVVRWLVERLRHEGWQPAILLRGYKRSALGISDEQAMLADLLPGIPVHAQANRAAAARKLLLDHPHINLLVLDDGFQHRRLARDFDLVLIDAREPFGYAHVLPRGLLREPLSGLARASAFVITHSNEIPQDKRARIEQTLREYNAPAPIYHARHVLTGLTNASRRMTFADLANTRFFAVAGIGRPDGLDKCLSRCGDAYRGHRWFEDHHDYRNEDLAAVWQDARTAGADLIVVTQKDWAKIRCLPGAGQIPIWQMELQIEFEESGEAGLTEFVCTTIEKKRADV